MRIHGGVFIGLLAVASVGGGLVGAGWNQPQPVYHPDFNLSCPQPQRPQVNVSCPQPRVTTEEARTNWAQPPYEEVGFELAGSTLSVYDVDTYGEIYGKSMQPLLWTGHTAIMEEFDGQDLEEGDIIRFQVDGGGHAVHSVQGDYQEDGYVWTRGVNNRYGQRVELDAVTHVVKGVLYTSE